MQTRKSDDTLQCADFAHVLLLYLYIPDTPWAMGLPFVPTLVWFWGSM